MTTDLWCAPDIHLAIVDDDVVVLDVPNDRYLCLLGIAPALRVMEHGGLHTTDSDLADALIEEGLASRQPLQHRRSAPVPARRDVPPADAPSGVRVWSALLSWSVSSLLFRGKPLPWLIQHHVGRRALSSPLDQNRLSLMTGAARRARIFLPFEGECLKRSFQLRCWLASQGVSTNWIFGVRTWPFAAHCWLQIDDLVVGDRLERVRRYTPILSA